MLHSFCIKWIVFISSLALLLAAVRQAPSGNAKAAPGSPSKEPDWTAGGDQENSWFGEAVSTAGDVNGDGYSDVLVGAMGYDNGQPDEGKVFVYYGSAQGLSKTANWSAQGNQAGALFGSAVAAAGDVNGDGFGDILIGARNYNAGQQAAGRVFLYYGSAQGLADAPGWTASGDQDGDQFGIAVAAAGDVNHDGYSDVLIGASWYDNQAVDAGRVFVYHGSADGLSTAPDWTADGNQANGFFGSALAGAGDVNGDGYGDVLIGAYGYDLREGMEGQALVYVGSAEGLLPTPAWTAYGDQKGACLGGSVSTAGDVNKDGYSDILVGPSENCGGLESRAFAFYGSAGGPSAAPDWSADSGQAESDFGTALAAAGDFNGDGTSDIIIGAPRYDNGQEDEGQVFVYHGSAAGLANIPNWSVESNQALAYFGGSLAAAGDVNRDGSSDVIIGAWFYDSGQAEEGQAFVYHGQKNLLPRLPWSENIRWLSLVHLAGALYFGVRLLGLIGIVARLLAALISGVIKWPGPTLHRSDPAGYPGRQPFSLPAEHLFSTFSGYLAGLAGAFLFALMSLLSATPVLAGRVQVGWTWELLCVTGVVYLGGWYGAKRASRHGKQIRRLLDELAGE